MDRYNAQHYLDPTAAEALSRIEQVEKPTGYRPRVFICSPYAGYQKINSENARRYLRFAVDKGAIPFAPHLLYPQIMNDNDPQERHLALFFGLVWLRTCHEVWVFGSYISSGMASEIDKAKYHGIPVRYFTENCQEVKQK